MAGETEDGLGAGGMEETAGPSDAGIYRAACF